MTVDLLTCPFGRYLDVVLVGTKEPLGGLSWVHIDADDPWREQTGSYSQFVNGKALRFRGRYVLRFDGNDTQRRGFERWLNPIPEPGTGKSPV